MFFIAVILCIYLFSFECYSQSNCWEVHQRIKLVYSASYSNGFLWVCIDRGLASINTETLEVHHYNKLNSLLVPDNVLTATICKSGNLWLGTLTKGVIKYDFEKWTVYNSKYNYLLGDRVYKLQNDYKGNVFVGNSRGLSVFIGDTLKPILRYYETKNIALDSNGVIWSIWGSTLYRIEKDTVDKSYYLSLDGRRGINIKSIAVDLSNKVFVAGNNGIYYFADEKHQKYDIDSIKDKSIEYIAFDRSGNLWILTQNEIYIHKDSLTTKLLIPESFLPRGQKISHIEFDDKNNAWFCTFDGVIRYDGQNFSFVNLNSKMILNNSIINVKSIDECIWIFTEEEAIRVCNNKWDKFEHSTFSSQITDISKDKQGDLWFTSYNDGVAKFDGAKWQIFQKTIKYFPANGALNVEIDLENRKWFATINEGIALFDDEKWYVFSKSKGNFITDNINDIKQDKNGSIWIGTSNYGLIKINSFNDANLNYELTEIRKYVNVIQVINNEIWVGGYGWGIAVLRDNYWQYYDTHSGLPSNNIYSIIKDKNDKIWVSTDKGIAIFNSGQWFVINSDNSPLYINSIIAIAIDDDNNKWIGTGNNGIYVMKCDYNVISREEISSDYNRISRFFPNPCREFIYFKNFDGNIIKIDIIDVFGNVLLTIENLEILSNTNKIDLGTLPNGLLIIKCYTKKDFFIEKIIKTN